MEEKNSEANKGGLDNQDSPEAVCLVIVLSFLKIIKQLLGNSTGQHRQWMAMDDNGWQWMALGWLWDGFGMALDGKR